jgi:hypothetical protein
MLATAAIMGYSPGLPRAAFLLVSHVLRAGLGLAFPSKKLDYTQPPAAGHLSPVPQGP